METTEALQQQPNLRKRAKVSYIRKLISQRYFLVMTIPFMVCVLIFNYLPLWGWIMAFQKYKPGFGVWHSPFVGFQNFKQIFSDSDFYNALRNTFAMSILNLGTVFVCSIGLALMLNEVRQVFFKKVFQTISYIPHFVSWVVIANIILSFLSPDGGVINELLVKFGLVHESIYFMTKASWFWYIETAANLWKELGWSTIIYLAVLAGLNPEHYDAADVDGASRFQKMRYISIPGIMPTAILLLILSLGWLIQGGYEAQFLLQNNVVLERSEVLDLYALRYSTEIGDFSYGVAISMFKSVVAIILVLSVNFLAKRTGQSSLF